MRRRHPYSVLSDIPSHTPGLHPCLLLPSSQPCQFCTCSKGSRPLAGFLEARLSSPMQQTFPERLEQNASPSQPAGWASAH